MTFLENSWNILGKNLQKNLLKYFENYLYYLVKVCVKNFPKICHFQSSSNPFTSPFTA